MLQKMIPRKVVHTIYEIDLEELKRRGVQGVITDLDNTLVGARAPTAPPELIEWFGRVKQAGFQLVIVSNNNKLRVSEFADPLQIPYIYQARKPFHLSFKRALSMMSLSPEQAVVIGDQLLTDVLGGNRLGLYTILVTPIAPTEEGIFTRVNRRVEKVIKARLKRTGRLTWKDDTIDRP